ncbi:MAG: PQQ-binding-like beta-propeller repeat protein [Planctomycetaceae bacterium]|nr:PQQ-binding-like beta-propeller repeat protein [Planctomycetaceae bacterium]
MRPAYVALVFSHLAAPYAAARSVIRYQLDGVVEFRFAALATVAILISGALAFGRLRHQPLRERCTFGSFMIGLWLLVTYAQLVIAVDSAVPRWLLTIAWALGMSWVAWLPWGLSFFRWRGFLTGSLLAGLCWAAFWNRFEITGLTGDARLEFALRKHQNVPKNHSTLTTNRSVEPGNVLWSGYLGSERSAFVRNGELSDPWDQHPPVVLWRTSCGSGWSSFAVTDNALFSQEQIPAGIEANGQAAGSDAITCRDPKSGDLIWAVAEDRPGYVSTMGGNGPRATPLLHSLNIGDKERLVVYGVGPTGMVSCLAADDGTRIWQQDLATLFPGDNLPHGVCASPVIANDRLIVCPPSPSGPAMVALDPESGDLLWKSESDWRSSYASPAIFQFGGQIQVVLHASPGVMAVDPETGSLLWSFPWTNEWDNNATQPLQVPESDTDLIIATGYQGGAVRLHLQPQGDNTAWTPSVVWETRSTLKTKFCNMAAFGNTVVGLDNGILCGVDMSSGKRLWKGGRYGHGQMLRVGSRLLVLEEQGGLQLLQPDAGGHHPIAQAAALDRKTWNHPVLVKDRLFIRNDQEIMCLQLSAQTSQGLRPTP